MEDERIVIVVEGGVVQHIMTDNPESRVACFLVDYDNLKGGQTTTPGEWPPELNPEQVELCVTGEHPDMKQYLDRNRESEYRYAVGPIGAGGFEHGPFETVQEALDTFPGGVPAGIYRLHPDQDAELLYRWNEDGWVKE